MPEISLSGHDDVPVPCSLPRYILLKFFFRLRNVWHWSLAMVLDLAIMPLCCNGPVLHISSVKVKEQKKGAAITYLVTEVNRLGHMTEQPHLDDACEHLDSSQQLSQPASKHAREYNGKVRNLQ